MSEINEMEALKQQLAEARKLILDLAESANAFEDAKREINKEVKSHYEAINELEGKKRQIDNDSWDIRKKLQETRRRLDSLEMQASEAEAKEKLRQQWQKMSDEFDTLAKQFEWNNLAFPHQREGAKKLAMVKRGVLGDKRGLGKTLTAIAWSDLVGANKILAIVPNDVMGNFEREIRHWAPHRSVHILGNRTKQHRNAILDIVKDVNNIIVIFNYEAWRKDFNLLERLAAVQFDTIICDEAHMMKEMNTVSYRGVEQVVYAENQCNICGGVPRPFNSGRLSCSSCGNTSEKFGDFCSIKNVLPMTGTPILNKPQDIFPLLKLVDRERFYDKSVFLNTYAQQNLYTGKWEFKTGGAERLTRELASIYVARDRNSAGISIPKQSIQYYNLELDPTEYPEQYKAYQTLSQKAALLVDDMMTSDESGQLKAMPVLYQIVLITRQRQMITWPAGIEFKHPKTGELLFKCDIHESIKVDRCIDRSGEGLIPEFVLDEGERVVLFSQFVKPLEEIERRCKEHGIRAVRYDGSTPDHIAQEIQIDFDRKYQNPDKPPKWDIVLAHYKKGGVGLNLNAATQTIILDEEWNPGKVDQAYGRTDRLGQTEETTVHVLRVDKTIDTWMQSLIEDKANMIAGFESNADLQQQFYDIITGIAKDFK